MWTDQLPAGSKLTVDQVAQAAPRDRREVLRAIDSRHLRARQERGEWVILVEDMRRWLTRR